METPANALRRFIKEHPSHFEAKASLLMELKRIAEQKTSEGIGAGAGMNTALALSDEVDQAIWGEYAQLYSQVLPYHLEQCRLMGSWWFDNPCDSEYFIHSQTMKNLAHMLFPKVEACLRRQPMDDYPSGAWVSLSELVETMSFRYLVQTLAFLPIGDIINDPVPLQVPLMDSIINRYRARSNWQKIIDFQEVRWEMMRANLEKMNDEMLYEFVWPDMQNLLEAYLRLEKNSEANEFIRIWSQSPVWPQIKQSAVELAERCGKGTLVEQWKK